MIKTLEAQVGQFLVVCKCPVSRGIVVQEPDSLGDLPAAFFLQYVLQLPAPAEMSNVAACRGEYSVVLILRIITLQVL